MRGAGLPINVISEYIKLTAEGEKTEEKRMQLLTNQREILIQRIEEMNSALNRLNYKIDIYSKNIKK